mmetsp:Transcript_23976/g.72182  ORF Transcript_23976/g.72182 Transcript_23976/m.72182 type:complete len:338 (-) Transcript_23976:1554-2567(-)
MDQHEIQGRGSVRDPRTTSITDQRRDSSRPIGARASLDGLDKKHDALAAAALGRQAGRVGDREALAAAVDGDRREVAHDRGVEARGPPERAVVVAAGDEGSAAGGDVRGHVALCDRVVKHRRPRRRQLADLAEERVDVVVAQVVHEAFEEPDRRRGRVKARLDQVRRPVVAAREIGSYDVAGRHSERHVREQWLLDSERSRLIHFKDLQLAERRGLPPKGWRRRVRRRGERAVRARVHARTQQHELPAAVAVVRYEEVVAAPRPRHEDPLAHRRRAALVAREKVRHRIDEERVGPPRLLGARGRAHASGERVRGGDARLASRRDARRHREASQKRSS